MNIVSQRLEEIVSKTLSMSEAEYAREIASANKILGYGHNSNLRFVSDVRPKYITGDPEDVAAHSYVLIFSLNHRYICDESSTEVRRDYKALNQSVRTHLDACLNYFKDNRSIYRFFTAFVPTLRAFGAGIGCLADEWDDRTVLRRLALFVDHVPYFSAQSRQFTEHLDMSSVRCNRELHETIVRSLPPRAILLNGKNTFSVMDDWSYFRPQEQFKAITLETKTARGPCTVEVADYVVDGERSAIRVLRTNFLRSINGPNTAAQLREVGALLGGG